MDKAENNTYEEAPNNNTPADRGKPLVAEISDSQKLIGALIIGLGIIALAFMFTTSTDKNTPKPLTAAKEIPFKSPGNSAPYIASDPDNSSLHNTNPIEAQKEIAMQQAALQMAMDQQRKLEKRNLSRQIVYDQQTSSTQAPSMTPGPSPAITSTQSSGAFQVSTIGGEPPTGAIPNSGNNAVTSGSGSTANDPNIAFANQNADKGVETAQASQLHNLHTLIAQGAMIPGILETAIESDLPGMVRAIVSENIYSFDGTELLIPEGSRLIGQYRSGLVNGQSRVFVIWNRLIRNDGVSINVASYGTDELGRSGLAGDVDAHFFERFGSSVMLSMIDSGLQAAANSANSKASTAVAVNTGTDFSNAAAIALQNAINIPPTINIDQGTRINVFVGKDLDFSNVRGNKPVGELDASGQ